MQSIDVTVVVPAKKGDARIEQIVTKLHSLPSNYEYIVASAEGKGFAVVDAVKKAHGNIIVTCDTDFFDVSHIPDFVDLFKRGNVDILIGERAYLDKRCLKRQVCTKLYNFYKQCLFGKLPDTQSGFKIFHKRSLLFLQPFEITGLAWDTEFIAKAKDMGFSIAEERIPENSEDGTTKLSNGYEMVKDLTKLWYKNRTNKIFSLISLIYLLGLLYASMSTPIPIGADVYFHFDVADYYAKFQLGMFSPTVLELNHFPYPPIFHLLLVPSIWMGLQNIFARFLQIALPLLIYCSTVFFVRYYSKPSTQLTTALLLLSTMGFIDGTIQCRPQGLAMILIPVFLYHFIENKDNHFVASTGALAYIHGVAGIANYWLLVLYGFIRGCWKKTFVKIAVVLSPIIISTLVYLGGAVSKWGGVFDTYQEYLIFTQPQEMIPYYSGMCLIGWVFLAYNLLKWHETSDVEKTLSLSLIGLMIMIPLWADRFLQYSTITLASLTAFGLEKHQGAKKILYPLIIIMYLLVMLNLFWITFTNNWWLYPQ